MSGQQQDGENFRMEDESIPAEINAQRPVTVETLLQLIANSQFGKDELLTLFQSIHQAIHQLAPDLLDSSASTSDSENFDASTGKRKSKGDLKIEDKQLKVKKVGTTSMASAQSLGHNQSIIQNISQKINQSHSQQPNKISNNNAKSTASSKPPPIVIRNNQKWRETRKYLIDNGVTFNTAQCTRDGMKIQTPNMTIYKKALNLLRDQDHPIQHHTFLPAEERDLHVVIRGTGMELSPEEALEELQALGFHPIKILRMKHPIYKREMPLLLIILPKDENSRRIYNIKELCDIIINVEPLRKSPVVGQCRRCQLYGHSHTQCFAEYRCKHCAQNHDSKTCNKNAKNETDIWCCNCGGQHRASFRGCDKAPAFRPPTNQTEPAPRQGPAPSVYNTRTFPNLPPTNRQPAPGRSFSQPPQQANLINKYPKPTTAQVLKMGINKNNKTNTLPTNQQQILEQMQATMHSMSLMFANMVQIMNNQCPR